MKLLHPTSMAFPVLAILMACTEAPGAEQEAISPTTNSTSVSVNPGSIADEWRILSIDGLGGLVQLQTMPKSFPQHRQQWKVALELELRCVEIEVD